MRVSSPEKSSSLHLPLCQAFNYYLTFIRLCVTSHRLITVMVYIVPLFQRDSCEHRTSELLICGSNVFFWAIWFLTRVQSKWCMNLYWFVSFFTCLQSMCAVKLFWLTMSLADVTIASQFHLSQIFFSYFSLQSSTLTAGGSNIDRSQYSICHTNRTCTPSTFVPDTSCVGVFKNFHNFHEWKHRQTKNLVRD